ncbi:8141_t:CDS:1, partial [Entrophospora sp. SA101]
KGFIQRSLGYVQSEIVNAEEVSEEEKRLTEFAVPGEPGIFFKNI